MQSIFRRNHSFLKPATEYRNRCIGGTLRIILIDIWVNYCKVRLLIVVSTVFCFFRFFQANKRQFGKYTL